MSESLLKLIEIVQHQTELVDKGWAYFSTVTLAVLGVVVLGTDRIRTTKAVQFIAIGGYLVFAVGNLLTILRAQSTAIRYITLLNREMTAAKLNEIVELADPFLWWQIAPFYILITCAVVAVIASSDHIRIDHPIEFSVST